MARREWAIDAIELAKAPAGAICRVCGLALGGGDALRRTWGAQDFAHLGCGYWRSGDSPADIERVPIARDAQEAMGLGRGENVPKRYKGVESVPATAAPPTSATWLALAAARRVFSRATVRPIPATEWEARAELERLSSARRKAAVGISWEARAIQRWLDGEAP